jgi:hypothetical protein
MELLYIIDLPSSRSVLCRYAILKIVLYGFGVCLTYSQILCSTEKLERFRSVLNHTKWAMSPVLIIILWTTESYSRVGRAPASYSGGFEFISQLEYFIKLITYTLLILEFHGG